MRLVLLALATLLLPGCITRHIRTTVERPADIVLPAGRAVSLQVKESCRRVDRGPDHRRVEVERRTEQVGWFEVERTHYQTVRYNKTRQCPRDPVRGAFSQALAEETASVLQYEGHRVQRRGKRASRLRMDVQTFRVRDLEFVGQRTDTERDRTCTKLCGRTTCDTYMLRGYLDVRVNLRGPKLAGVAQSHAVNFRSSALSGGAGGLQRVVCSRRDVEAEWRDPRRYDWAMAYEDAVRHIVRMQRARAFSPYSERYDVVIFDQLESFGNEEGASHAASHRWPLAVAAFEGALDEDAVKSDRVTRARVTHNIAACRLMLGQLKKARNVARQAQRLQKDNSTATLIAEIERRMADERRRAHAPRARRASR